jgi:hypothetical protein
MLVNKWSLQGGDTDLAKVTKLVTEVEIHLAIKSGLFKFFDVNFSRVASTKFSTCLSVLRRTRKIYLLHHSNGKNHDTM